MLEEKGFGLYHYYNSQSYYLRVVMNKTVSSVV